MLNLCGNELFGSEFPETAVIGETLDARLAGELAAIKTVRIPITMPQIIPIILMPKSGMSENSPPTKNFSAADSIQVVNTPSESPMGIASLHQLRASSLTNLVI